MTWYTFATQALVNAQGDAIVENATGGKFVAVKNGPALPIRDLNGVTISTPPGLTTSAYGETSQFQAEDMLHGYVQFGDAVVRVWADEVADLALGAADALVQANSALAAAQDAQANAQATADALQAFIVSGGGSGGGLPAGTTLDQIPNGPSGRLAMTQAERDRLAGLPTTFLQIGTTATTAKAGNFSPTAASVGALGAADGGFREWKPRPAAQGYPTAAEGAQEGDVASLYS